MSFSFRHSVATYKCLSALLPYTLFLCVCKPLLFARTLCARPQIACICRKQNDNQQPGQHNPCMVQINPYANSFLIAIIIPPAILACHFLHPDIALTAHDLLVTTRRIIKHPIKHSFRMFHFFKSTVQKTSFALLRIANDDVFAHFSSLSPRLACQVSFVIIIHLLAVLNCQIHCSKYLFLL